MNKIEEILLELKKKLLNRLEEGDVTVSKEKEKEKRGIRD
jgi:hypothetical protein